MKRHKPKWRGAAAAKAEYAQACLEAKARREREASLKEVVEPEETETTPLTVSELEEAYDEDGFVKYIEGVIDEISSLSW